jgi:H+/Cl- antiporter ClcA
MKIDKLSISEIITLLSVAAISVHTVTQVYVFYRFDALWLLSFISPSIYIIDVIVVFVILVIVLLSILGLWALYEKLTRKNRIRNRITYAQGQDISKLLIKNRARLERNFFIFILMPMIVIFCMALAISGFNGSLTFFTLIGFFIGSLLQIVQNKSLKKLEKYIMLIMAVFFAAMTHGEYQYLKLHTLSNIIFVENNIQIEGYKIFQINKPFAVLYRENKNRANEFKIIDLNQIHSVSEIKHN